MISRQLLLATYNQGKLDEIRQLLRYVPFDLRDLNSFRSIKAIEESGSTFVENATLKAVGYATQTRLMTLADDSGLEVDALGGCPGVRSARYAGKGASDAQRVEKLLQELSNTPDSDRGAQFVSAIAISAADGTILKLCVGICRGCIARQPRGAHGFGYDPVFIPDGMDRTFAELGADVKNEISHRAIAVKEAVEFLRSLTDYSRAG
ncbi:MAG TPA: RdgB/HAM1 family non-canonical purine NTP pyrophosphatase [Pyrinomonadaceae bacterium]|jgi:XTP/dITP diphosphohydrolase|nr:RdgB/HAM1 family non-canonical purine NTP pyrophosphatase [Pyrinomonadaceae bacterium]